MSKEQLSDILAELALDPVMFVETMLQVKPEKWQREFLQNVSPALRWHKKRALIQYVPKERRPR